MPVSLSKLRAIVLAVARKFAATATLVGLVRSAQPVCRATSSAAAITGPQPLRNVASRHFSLKKIGTNILLFEFTLHHAVFDSQIEFDSSLNKDGVVVLFKASG